MELNQKLDAIIIGKIADRKNIDNIESTDILLNCLSIIGNISSQVKKNKSPLSYLSPLFINVTLLARKSNINLGAILDSDQFSFKMNSSNVKFAISNLSIELCELNFNSLDFMSIANHSKDEIKSIHLDSMRKLYVILKLINLIASCYKSDFKSVQSNTMKHLDQLIKII